MRIVVALGGNALLRRGEPMTAEKQRANVRRAAVALAGLARAGHALLITHGNGPQVGLLALQAAAGPPDGVYPLDILGAESEGMIGYLIEQELGALLPGRQIATLLTQTLVDPADPSFRRPTKPIGPLYDEPTARRLAAERGWQVAQDGKGWRRVVASPRPLSFLETKVFAMLLERETIVICTGGGGIPVISRPDGSLAGVEAVVDKDFASALLARQLDADFLLLLTDVDAVYSDFGTPQARPIRRIDPLSFKGPEFAPGSMGPKMAAAISFAVAMRRPAAIGRTGDALAILSGESGTRIECRPAGDPPGRWGA